MGHGVDLVRRMGFGRAGVFGRRLVHRAKANEGKKPYGSGVSCLTIPGEKKKAGQREVQSLWPAREWCVFRKSLTSWSSVHTNDTRIVTDTRISSLIMPFHGPMLQEPPI